MKPTRKNSKTKTPSPKTKPQVVDLVSETDDVSDVEVPPVTKKRKRSSSTTSKEPPVKKPRKVTPTKATVEPKVEEFVEPSEEVPEDISPAHPHLKPFYGGFRSFASRAEPSPPNAGCKEIPKGSATCLKGCNFVISGVLDSLSRDEAQALIEAHGGYLPDIIR